MFLAQTTSWLLPITKIEKMGGKAALGVDQEFCFECINTEISTMQVYTGLELKEETRMKIILAGTNI